MSGLEINEVYDAASLLIENERWSLIDDLLNYYANAAWRINADLLLVWAQITFPIGCSCNLKNRRRFIEQCMKFHNDKSSLWKSLI